MTPETIQLASRLGLLAYQMAWLKRPDRFKIGLWARQTGKDYTCAAEAVLTCLGAERVHWLILAASERQALESLQKARDWAERVHDHDWPGKTGFKASSNLLAFENGSRIRALPGKPETVRGYSGNVILTEFAFHEHQEKLWNAVFPMVTNPMTGGEKKLRIITTPNGRGTFFYQLWQDWAFYKEVVPIQKARDLGLEIDLGVLRQGIANPEAWAQEYECAFTDTSTVLLPYELIQSCASDEASEVAEGDALSRCRGEIFCGIDFGRTRDLTVCWVLERTAGILWTREVLVLDRMSTPEQAAILKTRVRRARRTSLDATGAGVGLGDLLAQEFGSKLELCQFTQAFKHELFPRLRSAFERGLLRIPASRAIRDDLHGVERVVSNNARISYRARNSADGHSDRCTALALALRAAETGPPALAARLIEREFRLRL